MSKCDICGKRSEHIPVIRTTTAIIVGQEEEKEDYHQILICPTCIITIYREYILAPKNQSLDLKEKKKRI